MASEPKKEMNREIEKQLTNSLSSFEVLLGNKRFNKRIKKARKAFTKGMKAKFSETADGVQNEELEDMSVMPATDVKSFKSGKKSKAKRNKV